MGRLKKRQTQGAAPLDMSPHKTERTAAAILMHWMRNIIEEKHLDLGFPDVETISADRKMPDFLICESRRSDKALCLIEAKIPQYNVFNYDELKEPARKKASKRKAKYFAVTNFQQLIWYKTNEANAGAPEEEQIAAKYELSRIENLDEIEHARFSEPIKKALEDFLTKLYSVSTGKIPEPKLAVDEFLVYRLHEKIKTLSRYYKSIIYDKANKDKTFAKSLNKWFFDQGWNFTWLNEDFDKAARQTAYLLVNKILFYNLLQAKRPNELDPLEIPASLIKGSMLQVMLQGYFKEVLKIDYETIYTTDFIDTIAFPDERAVVEEIKELVYVLKEYDFSTLGYDIIGRIFERLIPPEERHNLGQYFTPPDVVDLILGFCLSHEDDKVIDPSCGAGTFLVRAYQNKKLMNQMKNHEDILENLWGCDIAKFPAHLSTINLTINDLGSDKNYPNILNCDFFSLLSGTEGFNPEKWRKARAKTLGVQEREIIHPRWFNAVVGNPPYTRQEEIGEISTEDVEYKNKMIANALNFEGEKIADIGKRAGIHAYFFIHGAKFLRDGGSFGFIVSNSWMDVDYGKGLQEFFLNHFKIVAIIESKVERWFEEADINTCIIILEKCTDKMKRDSNLVRFVYLKKTLRDMIPPARDLWEKQVSRHNAIKAIKKSILAHEDLYENDTMRIFPKLQGELFEEGFDEDKHVYTGSKWGKYLRAPDVFFKIISNGKNNFIPLKEISDVKYGIKSGANEFFFLTEEQIKREKIEKEFYCRKLNNEWIPNYLIKSPKECRKIIIKQEYLNFIVLMIHKNKKQLTGKNVLRYIKKGERLGFNDRKSCRSRGDRWYDLNEVKAPILSKLFINTSFCYFLNPENHFVDHTFFVIDPNNRNDVSRIAAFLNSTVGTLFTEVFGRTMMGEGVLLLYGPEIKPMPIIKPELMSNGRASVIKNALSADVESIFLTLGADTPDMVSLDTIKPYRRELDKIIMGDILGLTDEEQLEVYRAVIDMVKSRIDRAGSVENNSLDSEGIDMASLSKTVVDTIDKG